MIKITRRALGVVAMGATALVLLSGCGLIPKPPTLADFEGTWVYEAADGNTSTIVIDADGNFTIDRAPFEVFNLPVQREILNWDGRIDWAAAAPSSGEVWIHESGAVSFTTMEPESIAGAKRLCLVKLC